MSNHLLRSHAPIPEAAWGAIDQEATSRLKTYLAGRRLVDFDGPHGWDFSGVNLGRAGAVTQDAAPGVEMASRRLLPLVELRVPFSVSRRELADVERGALDIDFDDLDRATRSIAFAENMTVLHGNAPCGIVGVTEASSHQALSLPGNYDSYPNVVARAVSMVMEAGLAGPYALALSRDVWIGVLETAEHGGYPLFEHLRSILGGPILWAPGIEGAVVLSQRGGDFLFHSGEDLSIGYSSHDADNVELYLEESFAFRVVEPDAAVALEGTASSA
jgi:uncharacterized linocin/CFP29 family protein